MIFNKSFGKIIYKRQSRKQNMGPILNATKQKVFETWIWGGEGKAGERGKFYPIVLSAQIIFKRKIEQLMPSSKTYN